MLERVASVELEINGITYISVDGAEKDFLIAVARDEKQLARKRDLMEKATIGNAPIEERECDGGLLLIQSNELDVFKIPVSSNSPASQARYYFRSKYKAPAVQGYKISAGDETSFHAHFERTERLHLINGEADIFLNGFRQRLPRALTVNPQDKHMIKGVSTAFIVVITSGNEDCFSMEDHHYFPKPNSNNHHRLL